MATARPKGRPADLNEGEMRERLLRTAARLFAEAGYAATSIQTIVDAAGTTKPMVYYYFKNKEGLYRELVEEAFGRIREKYEQVGTSSGGIETKLVAVVEANFELYREMPEVARFALAPLLSPRKESPEVNVEALGTLNYHLVREIVAQGIEDGELAGDCHEIALALIGQIVAYKVAQFMNPEIPIIHSDAAWKVVRLLLDGARSCI